MIEHVCLGCCFASAITASLSLYPCPFDKLRNLDYSCNILNQIRWSIKLLKLSHFALASITSFSRPQAPFFEREREHGTSFSFYKERPWVLFDENGINRAQQETKI